MKKILLMLTAAMLTLTACQQKESFDFLLGENNIAVDFSYNEVTFEDTKAQQLYTQAFDAKHEAWETAFVRELNDDLEDIFLTAHRYSPTVADSSYIFVVEINEVCTKGFTQATVRVLDKKGVEQQTLRIKAKKELGESFTEAVFDSLEDLADDLGDYIKRGIR